MRKLILKTDVSLSQILVLLGLFTGLVILIMTQAWIKQSDMEHARNNILYQALDSLYQARPELSCSSDEFPHKNKNHLTKNSETGVISGYLENSGYMFDIGPLTTFYYRMEPQRGQSKEFKNKRLLQNIRHYGE